MRGLYPFLVLLSLSPSFLSAQPSDFELQALDRTFTEAHTDVDILAVRQGPVTVLVSSPSHTVTVHANALHMRPVPGAPAGTVDARLEVDLEGAGELVATVRETGSVIRDSLVAPRQSVEVAARLRLVRGVDGYLLEFVEARQETVDVRIESAVARQMVTACTAFRMFLGALDCTALAEGLSVARVPMPAPGTRYWLPYDALTAEDRAALDRFAAGPEEP